QGAGAGSGQDHVVDADRARAVGVPVRLLAGVVDAVAVRVVEERAGAGETTGGRQGRVGVAAQDVGTSGAARRGVRAADVQGGQRTGGRDVVDRLVAVDGAVAVVIDPVQGRDERGNRAEGVRHVRVARLHDGPEG